MWLFGFKVLLKTDIFVMSWHQGSMGLIFFFIAHGVTQNLKKNYKYGRKVIADPEWLMLMRHVNPL